MRSVFHSKFPCPRNSRPCTSSMMCFNIDLSSWRLVLGLFLREDVSHCKALLLRSQERFRSSPCSFHSRLGVSLFSWSSGQFQIAHQSRCLFRFTRLRLLCVSVVLTLVTPVSIDTRHLKRVLHRLALFFYLCNLFLFDLSLQRLLHKLLLLFPRQLLYVVLCVLGYTTLLHKIRVVPGYIASLSLLCDLFKIELLKLDALLRVLC